MFYIGSHLSTSKGFSGMGKQALEIGANVFQFFSRNPRSSKSKDWNPEDLKTYEALAREHQFGMILAHAPYIMNPCSADPDLRKLATEIFLSDLEKLESVYQVQYNFHPGSHVKQGAEQGIIFISDMLNLALQKKGTVPILLETMAGKGSEVGRNFEELAQIIANTNHHERMGVCLDTCHVFDGGYDLVNDLENVLQEFDDIIGLNRLKAIHLNDSKNICNSHKDRHEKIGEGNIGIEAITKMINHEKLRHLPFYLETPNELDGYAKEIALLKEKRTNL